MQYANCMLKKFGDIMKVAIAIWKDRIGPVFDVSKKILILEIENDSINKKTVEMFENDNPGLKVTKLVDLNIETLICGAISNPLLDMITLQGISTIPFTCGEISMVINAFLQNRLPDPRLTMPGCCGFRKRIRGQKQTAVNTLAKGVMIMPKGDGTGPAGQGPMTGKGKGRCGAKGRKFNNQKGSGGAGKQGGQGRRSGQRKSDTAKQVQGG
jgi:predicted Fe-Mo cluster-binding NifX family protein